MACLGLLLNFELALAQPFIVRLTRGLHRWIQKTVCNIWLIVTEKIFQDGGLKKTQILSPFPKIVKYWKFKLVKRRVCVLAFRKHRLFKNRSIIDEGVPDFHILACSRLLLGTHKLKKIPLSHLPTNFLANCTVTFRKMGCIW